MSAHSERPCGTQRRPDPAKRVNYRQGLVLGEDEFVTDQHHLRSRDHLGVRALHGYGTVSGLAVSVDEAAGELRVAPGLAVDPVGRLVCVPTEQCADLASWLTDHRDELVEGEEGALPDALSLYVVLCARECETDLVPVPAETCRTGEESMLASRLLETFELRLSRTPPAPVGEVADGGLAAVVARLLALASGEDGGGDDDDDRLATIRSELAGWTTRTRPELGQRPCLSALDDACAPDEDHPSTAVLLARVDLGVDGGGDGPVLAVGPEVVEDDRPVLVSSRLLQEWLTGLLAHPELFAVTEHSVLDNLDADDHPQYLLADGSRALTGPLRAGGHQLRDLARSGAAAHAMRRDEIVGGDLGASAGGAQLRALQGERLEASGERAPAAGDVLRYDGSRWTPATIEVPDRPDEPDPAPLGTLLPFVTIQLLDRQEATATFLLWCHLEAPHSEVVLVPTGRARQPLVYGEGVEVFTEACEEGRPALRRIATNRAAAHQIACNTFRLDINRQEAELLRFVFHLRVLRVSTGQSVAEFAADQGIAYVGQGPEQTVTAFVVNPALTRPLTGFTAAEHVVAPTGGGRLRVERGR